MKRTKAEKKCILHYSDQIAKDGIVVIDDITEMSVMDEPYVSQDYILGICHSGKVELEYDTLHQDFLMHDVSIVYPGHTLWIKRVSEDYCTTMVVVSAEVYADLSTHNSFRNRFHYEQHPFFHLNSNQFNDVLVIVDAMRTVGKQDVASRSQMMIALLDVVLGIIDNFRQQNERLDELAPQRLSSRFYHAVVEHHHKEHSVAFYANLFCLSPKYFSDVIKQETGHSAKNWIGLHLITAAKLLLQTRRDLNIQQISEMLGYDDQTSFSRHFRKETGMSPSEYRKHT